MKKYSYLKVIFTGIFAVILVACSTKIQENKVNTNNNTNTIPIDNSNGQKALDFLVEHFSNNIDSLWGIDEALVASTKNFVKYNDNYKSRVIVDFTSGNVSFETINKEYKTSLINEIERIVLMGSDIDVDSIFNNTEIKSSSNPFFLGQFLDSKGRSIKTKREANAYAKFLLNKVKEQTLPNGTVKYYINTILSANHLDVRAKKYIPIVRKQAKKYNLSENLIFSIIEVESAYNPFAVSYANAIGLMQIVPTTAGVDTFKFLGKKGKPSKRYLINPNNNIELGSVYLHLLNTKYFNRVRDEKSKIYLMISSYNSGPGATLRIFSKDMKIAINEINKLSSGQIYYILSKNHPSEQARNYLRKVSKAMSKNTSLNK